jgi:hypothetical protein
MHDETNILATTSAGIGLKIPLNKKTTVKARKINSTSNTPISMGNHQVREVETSISLGGK